MTLLYARRRVWNVCRLSLLTLLAVVASASVSAQIAFPITFEETIDYELVGFAGAENSTVVTDPTDASNHVVQVVRAAGAETYAGTVVAATSGLAAPVPFAPGTTTMSIRVWTPAAGTPVRLKVEQNGNSAVAVEAEATSTVGGAYETLVFDFANEASGPALDFSETYDKVVVFFNFGAAGAPEATYYFDDIAFGDGGGGTPRLVINEVDADTPGSDVAEFVELYNAGDADATLDGHVLVFFNGNGDVSYAAFDLTGTLAPGEFYVVGNPGVPGVDLTFDPGGSGFLQNGADAVALYTGAATDFPNATAPTATNLVDALVYGTADPDATGLLTALGETTQYDESANGDNANESVQRSPDGADTFITALATPGATNALPAASASFTALLRGENEVSDNNDSDAKGGVTAVLDDTTLTVSGTFAGLSSAFAAAHLHGGAAEENGPVVIPLVATTTADMLGGSFDATANTFEVRPTFADSIRAGLVYVNVHSADYPGGEIRGQLGTDVDMLPVVLSGANEVDPVTTAASGTASVALDGASVTVTGAFMGLSSDYAASHIHAGAAGVNGPVVVPLVATVDAGMLGGTWEAASNTFEVRPTFADSIRAGLAYLNVHSADHPGGEIRGQIGFGTPEVVVMSIADVRAAGTGQTVTVAGIVTRTRGRNTYIQDGTAGVNLFQTTGAFADSIASGAVAQGDSLVVTGTTAEFNGLFEISPVTSFTVVSRGNDLPEAQVVTLAEIAANGEQYESELIQVENLMVVTDDDGAFDSGSGSGKTYQVSDPSLAAGTVALRVPGSSDTAIGGVTIPAGPATFTGVLGQFDSSDPKDEGYQLAPIDATDVVMMNTANEDGAEAGLSLTVANPVHQSATVRFSLGTPGTATVALYDALGRLVVTLADGEMGLGVQTARLDAAGLASGVYVLRLEAGAGVVAKTITVVR